MRFLCAYLRWLAEIGIELLMKSLELMSQAYVNVCQKSRLSLSYRRVLGNGAANQMCHYRDEESSNGLVK
jgi:hypothetical protein